MNVLLRSVRPAAAPAAIDPAKAWMLGLVPEADGTIRPAPTAPLAFGPAPLPEERARKPLVCACPDYCELEHDLI